MLTVNFQAKLAFFSVLVYCVKVRVAKRNGYECAFWGCVLNQCLSETVVNPKDKMGFTD